MNRTLSIAAAAMLVLLAVSVVLAQVSWTPIVPEQLTTSAFTDNNNWTPGGEGYLIIPIDTTDADNYPGHMWDTTDTFFETDKWSTVKLFYRIRPFDGSAFTTKDSVGMRWVALWSNGFGNWNALDSGSAISDTLFHNDTLHVRENYSQLRIAVHRAGTRVAQVAADSSVTFIFQAMGLNVMPVVKDVVTR